MTRNDQNQRKRREGGWLTPQHLKPWACDGMPAGTERAAVDEDRALRILVEPAACARVLGCVASRRSEEGPLPLDRAGRRRG